MPDVCYIKHNMSRKFPMPMFSGMVQPYEDMVEVTNIVCNKCGVKCQPIRLKRTRGVDPETIINRAVALADHNHICNPLLLKDKDPGAGDRVVNIYHERKREQEKVGAFTFLQDAIKKTVARAAGHA